MKKNLKINRGRLYNKIDKIITEYNYNFRKEFNKQEFEDKEALNEVILLLRDLKYIKIRKNTIVFQPLGIRYLKDLYIDYNRYEMNLKLNFARGL